MQDDDRDTAEAEAPLSAAVAVLGADPGFSLARLLRRGGLAIADAEPAPKQASEALACRFHFGLASARAGTLGEVRRIADLLAQARSLVMPESGFWPQPDGSFVDGWRPEVDGAGLPDLAKARAFRRAHLGAVAQVLTTSDTLVLPLLHVTALRDPATGSVFAEPPPGVAHPDPPRHRAEAADLDAAFARLHAEAQAAHPGLRLHLVVPPARPEDPAETRAARDLLAAQAALWARSFAGVRHDPVFDALLGRAAALPADHPELDALASVLARLGAGADLLEIVAGSAAPLAAPAPDAGRQRRQKDPERRARRKAKAEAKGKGAAAKVMCEDELLEAFSK